MPYKIDPEIIFGQITYKKARLIAGNFSCYSGAGLVLSGVSSKSNSLCMPVKNIYRRLDQGRLYFPETFFGSAFVLKTPLSENLRFSAAFFYSRERKDLYQYDVLPNEIYVLNNGRYCKMSYLKLPDILTEQVFGGISGIAYDDFLQLSMSAYVSTLSWNTGQTLKFSPSAQYPDSGRFGAGGINLAYKNSFMKSVFEFAVSFLSSFNLNNRAFLAETDFDFFPVLINISGRYYGENFINPHGSGIYSPDEYEGNANRNEKGFGAIGRFMLSENTQITGKFDQHSEVTGQRKQTEVSGAIYRRFGKNLIAGLMSGFSHVQDDSPPVLAKWRAGISLFLHDVFFVDSALFYETGRISNVSVHRMQMKFSKISAEGHEISISMGGTGRIGHEKYVSAYYPEKEIHSSARLKLNILKKFPVFLGAYYKKYFQNNSRKEINFLWELQFAL
jgi:hypothetical protein